MTLYALKRYPDNLSAVIDTLDKDSANVSDFNHIMKASGWLLTLEEDRIPEHTLTVILMMISGYATKIELPIKDPAAGLYDLNRLYSYNMKNYPIHTTIKIEMLKDRDGLRPGDVIRTYTNGKRPLNE